MTIIQNDHVVEIDYTLKGDNGEVIDSSEQMGPLAFIQGKRNIIPGLESEISGKIIKVLVEDMSPIEYDQPLFLVDPS